MLRLAKSVPAQARMKVEASSDRIPVTLLTGFLGSGKTTVVNHLVRQPELADTLVIINEFGEMALDHLLVAHCTENVLMEMSSGCLCCTIRSDLVKTLHDINWRFARNGERQFRRVLIETTGVADPAPIIHTLMSERRIAAKYRFDGIVATVALNNGSNTLGQHVEAVKQAAMADVLLLTKGDIATQDDRAELAQRLKGLNPAAPRWEVRSGEIEPGKLLNLGLFSQPGKIQAVERWLREEADADRALHRPYGQDHLHRSAGEDDGHDGVNRHGDRIRAFCFTLDEPISERALIAWMEQLKQLLGNNILRVKGIVNVSGSAQPVVVHGAQHTLHAPIRLPAWPNQDRCSRLVFITQDVTRGEIEATFDGFRKLQRKARGLVP